MRRLLYIACSLGMLAISPLASLAGGSVPTSDIANGKMTYRDKCATCHGSSGGGDGYVQFDPPVADLTSPATQRKLDGELIKTIHTGRPNTARGAWRLALSAEEIHDVVAYLRTLKRD
jgi:mono/diheme cytochrome c family protein